MKKTILFLSASFFIILAGCSSAEEDEVLEYHNDFVDYTNPKLEEIEELGNEMDTAETNEEAYEIENDEIIPIVEDIKAYFDDQDPKEDVTKEYHDLRAAWADNYYEGFQAEDEAYEALLDDSGDEADELFDEADDQIAQANEDVEKANEKWDDIVDEYEFEEDAE